MYVSLRALANSASVWIWLAYISGRGTLNPAKQRLQKRQAFWAKLNRLLRSIRAKHYKLVAGDSNCKLRALPRTCPP